MRLKKLCVLVHKRKKKIKGLKKTQQKCFARVETLVDDNCHGLNVAFEKTPAPTTTATTMQTVFAH